MPAESHFNLLLNPRNRTFRAALNPYDVCTVISIYPKSFIHKSPTTQPATIHVKGGTLKEPALTTITPASWWREIDDSQPLLEITNSAIQVASAVVNDFCNGLFCCDMDGAMPGVGWVPGRVNIEHIQKGSIEFNDETYDLHAFINRLHGKQINYYKALVAQGDMLWARTNGNPMVIGDDMRLAAEALNYSNKPWMIDRGMIEMERCPACGTLGNPAYPICATCRFVKHPEKAKDMTFAEVK